MTSKKPAPPLVSKEIGDDSTEVSGDVIGESIKFREIRLKWDSLLDETEEVEEDVRVLMSGAFRASTLVVEINSVGREMSSRLIVPAAYLTLPSRVGVCDVWLRPRFVRLVNARARAIVEEAIADDWTWFLKERSLRGETWAHPQGSVKGVSTSRCLRSRVLQRPVW